MRVVCFPRSFQHRCFPDIEFPVEEFSAGKGMTPTPSIQPPFGVSKLKDERTNQMEGVAFPMQQRNTSHVQSIQLEATEMDFHSGKGDIRSIGSN